ncbi:DNA-directed RNA polymerase sigma-70 factor [Parapedobacter defluvii]|uniref:DNA-directed RNA polymerase sigma-70 factor n=1 Tax=Parapedobacter defluvii TaxID=2045106 RepID=A0ABQ1L0E7_9SPHI|nr:RNA polymerase sigma-70 factor [Parapedobacter defluvii]RQP08067.1 MAG: RNA polymerase sigma-70 factor [Parapedobacter sp.]GGC16807.1 DNA-directed RNA polymerase sigma-70 factor [Parapedobacter defluvii]
MRKYIDKADDELISLLKNDDEQAFTELYNRYWKKLFVIAANRITHIEDAEEIVQDIFTALWRRRQTLSLKSELTNYLAVSVKYRIIKMLDKYHNQERYIDSVVSQDQVDDSTQEWLAFEELRAELAKYTQQLPEKCRLVFQLSREDGYSQKQIAEALQISEKTVEAHLGKAFKTLRSKLASFMTTLL